MRANHLKVEVNIEALKHFPNPEKLGKVAVIMGGESAEREISLQSGKAVVDALKRQGVDVTGFEVRQYSLLLMEQMQHFDRVFIALHGRGGEDGTVQGLLDCLNVSYTGSGVLASALAMNKLKSKQIWQAQGLNTPDFCVLRQGEGLQKLMHRLESGEMSLPLMIKPILEGSSLGMKKVSEVSELAAALEDAFKYDFGVLAESFLPGPEYTVGIVKGCALPSICIKTARSFYDYQAKYIDDDTEFLVPSGLDEKEEQSLQQLALEAYLALDCEGWGRVDLMRDAKGHFSLIEVNTVPGLTSHSLVPKAAKAADIEFEVLVAHILDTAVLRKYEFSEIIKD